MSDPFYQAIDPFNGRAHPEHQKMMKDLDEHLYQLVISVFLNAQGELLLNALEDLYIRQPVCPPGSVKGWGHYREGQNSIVFKLRRMIEKARKMTP